MSHRSLSVVALTTCLVLALQSVKADAPNSVEVLPQLTTIGERPVAAVEAATITRTGAIDVDVETLDAMAHEVSEGATLALFDGVSVTARVNRIEYRGETSYSVGGALDDIQGGTIVFVREGDVVLGNVWAGQLGTYEIRKGDGGLVVHELNTAAFDPCGTPEPPMALPEGAGAPTEGQVCVDDGSEIKVLIAFTPASVAALGGQQQMLGFAQLCISTTNQAYQNSDIAPRAVLASFTQVDYVESGDGFIDRDRLTNTNDGFIDEIHDLRDQVDADVVSMIVNNIGACGVANFSVSFGNIGAESLAFNVTRRDCAVGNLSFPHELGHNQGSRHDRAADSNNGAFAYSHGFVAPNAAFRTVMATSNLAAVRIPFFSNPDIDFGGQPTGIASNLANSADNARSIDSTALVVANFRTEECVIPGDLNGDGFINGTDIAIMLSVWNSNGSGTLADINGDGIVNGGDLAFVLANWTG